jgi:hypothetical protein
MKKVQVKNATIKVLNHSFGIISKYIPGLLKLSDLPKPVLIVDPETLDEFPVNLVCVIPFSTIVPEAFSYLSEGKHPNECTDDLLSKLNVSSVNQLAFYVYQR